MIDNSELKQTLAEMRGAWLRELRQMPVSQVWDDIERLILALHFSDPVRRADAAERFAEDLLRQVGDCRRRLRETERWIANEERREAEARRQAAEQREARAKIVSLVG